MKEQLLGQMPRKLHDFSAWSSDRLVVMDAKFINSLEATFDAYMFVIIFSPFPEAKIASNFYPLGNRKIIAINPGQPLGARQATQVSPYTSLFLNSAFINSIAHEMYGKSPIWFSNFCCPLDLQLLDIVSLYKSEAYLRQLGSVFALQNYECLLAISLLRNVKHNHSGADSRKNPTDNNCITLAMDYMKDNIGNDFTLENIAQVINYSPCHFIRVFKAQTGKTPFEFLTELRIEQAKSMLLAKSYPKSITDISLTCGFNNLSHFSTLFKRKTGFTPRQFRDDFS